MSEEKKDDLYINMSNFETTADKAASDTVEDDEDIDNVFGNYSPIIDFTDNDEVENNVDEDIIVNENKKVNVVKEIISWILVLASAFVLAYFITNYVIVKAEVPTGSMENTIMSHDRIVGNRLAYLFSEPKRGDIIIFKFPDDEDQNFVKRIIGIPGDHVEIINGLIYINGSTEPLEEPYLKEEMNDGIYGPYDVPEGSYFVLGDNRNWSKDARSWTNTYVKKEKIIGKVWFRYSPSIGMIK